MNSSKENGDLKNESSHSGPLAALKGKANHGKESYELRDEANYSFPSLFTNSLRETSHNAFFRTSLKS